MINMIEILNRELRTALSLPKKIDRRSCVQNEMKFLEICENCDKCQNNSTKIPPHRHSLKMYYNSSPKKSLNYLTLAFSVSIILLLLVKQSEANPVPHHQHSNHHHHHHHTHHHHHHHRDKMSDMKIFDLKCGVQFEKGEGGMSNEVLTRRLNEILSACQDTLIQTKTLTDQYINALWNTSVAKHHEEWKNHEEPSWLHPDGAPLNKEFNKSINQEHKNDLLSIEWKNHEKVFEYLGKIYQRLQRIYVGVQLVNEWISMAKNKNSLLKEDEIEKSQSLFNNVTEGIHSVLCQIQELFMDVAIDPRTDLDVSPFKMDDLIKINHWLIYREYHNLMEYSKELLQIIVDRYDGSDS